MSNKCHGTRALPRLCLKHFETGPEGEGHQEEENRHQTEEDTMRAELDAKRGSSHNWYSRCFQPPNSSSWSRCDGRHLLAIIVRGPQPGQALFQEPCLQIALVKRFICYRLLANHSRII